MIFRIIAAIALLVASMERGAAEQPGTRIDLSALVCPDRFGVGSVFEESGLDCPEDRSTIAVSKGLLKVFSLRFPPFEQPIFLTKIKADPNDDATYRYQFIKATCRMDIDIRHQVRLGDQWKPLLVMEERRPSLSPEARLEAARRRCRSGEESRSLGQGKTRCRSRNRRDASWQRPESMDRLRAQHGISV